MFARAHTYKLNAHRFPMSSVCVTHVQRSSVCVYPCCGVVEQTRMIKMIYMSPSLTIPNNIGSLAIIHISLMRSQI